MATRYSTTSLGRPVQGVQDYAAALVATKVQDFQLEWNRAFSSATGASFQRRNGARTLLQFMEVDKQVSVDKQGRRTIKYV